MRRSGKILLILFVNMVILGLATFGLEFKLAHDRRQEETKWSQAGKAILLVIVPYARRHRARDEVWTFKISPSSVSRLCQLTEPKNPTLFDQ